MEINQQINMLFSDKRRNYMILVTAVIQAKPGKRNKLISKSRNVVEFTRLESGNISYSLYASTENEDVLLMFEQWENMDALRSHTQTEHFKAFGAAIEEFLAGDMDVTIYSADKYSE